MFSTAQRARKLTIIGLALSVMFGMFTAVAPQSPLLAPADAVVATGGSGLYKGSINWFEWDSADPFKTTTQTNGIVVGDQKVRVTCKATIRAGSGDAKTYIPGTWRGTHASQNAHRRTS